MGSSKRIINTELETEEILLENNLRPKLLCDYIGQAKAKENLKVFIDAAKGRGKPLTMYCYMDRRDLEKPHWQVLSPMKWELILR